MRLSRRKLLHAAAGAAVVPAVARVASASDYPTRPVHLIIGYPPGGSADMTARLTSQWLSEQLGQQFIVESRPGAATNTSAWYGIVAPKGTPAEIVDKLNQAINAMLTDTAAKARFIDLGASVLPGSAADFGNLIADETEKWGKVIKFAGIKPE